MVSHQLGVALGYTLTPADRDGLVTSIVNRAVSFDWVSAEVVGAAAFAVSSFAMSGESGLVDALARVRRTVTDTLLADGAVALIAALSTEVGAALGLSALDVNLEFRSNAPALFRAPPSAARCR